MSYGSVNSPENSVKGTNAVAQLSQVGDDGVESGSSSSVGDQADGAAPDEGERQSVWQSFKGFYERNIGLFFVFMAQVFASLVCEVTWPRLDSSY